MGGLLQFIVEINVEDSHVFKLNKKIKIEL